jgi:hypothetical protein
LATQIGPPSPEACSDCRLSVAFCGVVDQHVDLAEQLEGGLDHSLRTAVRSDHLVSSGERRAGEFDAHATSGAGDKVDLFVPHKASVMSQQPGSPLKEKPRLLYASGLVSSVRSSC